MAKIEDRFFHLFGQLAGLPQSNQLGVRAHPGYGGQKYPYTKRDITEPTQNLHSGQK